MEKKAYIKIFTSAIFAFVFLAIAPQFAHAANLYFYPSSGTQAVGTNFSVSVYVSSADQAMNAASGIVSFPADKLEVTSLSKTGSVFTLWVQEPSFSNSAGTVNFEGIVLNPGFTGSNGKAITITFRTKAAGNAPLTFSSGSALANRRQRNKYPDQLGRCRFFSWRSYPNNGSRSNDTGRGGHARSACHFFAHAPRSQQMVSSE